MTALVIDDDPIMLGTIPDILELLDFDTKSFDDPIAGLNYLEQQKPELVLCDLSMPQMTGLEVLQKAKELHPDAIFIVMTGYASIESAVEAMRMGASDYIQKPFTVDHLRLIIKKSMTEKQLRQENRELKAKLTDRYKFDNVIGRSQSMQKIFAQIEKVAPTNASVLIHGESGTGKEMIARAIHTYSLRKELPFVGVDCVAIPSHLLESELFGYEKGAFTGAASRRSGLLESAEKGTFFMDEVTEIDYDVQAKLLRVLQERQFRRVGGRDLTNVDIRILAATKRDPLQAVHDKIFREDLYYRLNVIPIELPSLRERKEDIPLLVNHFIKGAASLTNSNETTRIESDALNVLIGYEWPGNIRELKNIIERLCIMANDNVITLEDVPPEIRGSQANFTLDINWGEELTFKDAKDKWIEHFERDFLEKALKKHSGNISKAAEKCGVNRRTFHRLMSKYELGTFRDYRN
ncbi:MAG: sigma-54 dependent transcriptional regulator [Lentisphaeraceae bacterium]|nr:sigma-54 dependent transcriptional regulator [Lentisphaeraceae bacterium]